ncbi:MULTISPECIES: response regulator transcription factor [Sphingomonas]|uniref:DNA-binding NarL/FixJ family response regulator n=1 Tax=Sphingomonas leidyi TaxID=68569 RepID=A0A7X5ZU10_9SPHN|nr:MULTISPECIES: response regulator transcription factor [Sphingomonas]MBN8813426.1 response regulator transcription factor [Sphingomonas sp.]NIJ63540.1 DNA-binding NarL/FixJ family response regulator [Sphingomonas leidyi]OJY52928.1 MAG: DNA-binding response regulator [Sphingomonas sp. 67-41]
MPDSASPLLKVALVEDDIAFQNSFAAAVRNSTDMQLIGMAHNVAQARRMLAGDPLDVLVVDLGLPDGSGIDVIRAAHASWPDCGIMVSTTFADEKHVIASIEAGAAGYLLKDSSAEKIADEIRALHAGGSPISPRIARQILLRFRPVEQAPQVPTAAALATATPIASPLSPREREALELITKGFSYDEIAELMLVSRNTVMTFVRRIYQKLEVTSKAEAIFEARNHGIL